MCWLCHNGAKNDARLIHTYILENVSSVQLDVMVQEIHRVLGERHPGEMNPQQILEHIQSHILHPTVKRALMLRGLFRVCDEIQSTLDRRGEDLDVKLVESLCKVHSSILTVYKNGQSKLLFEDT